jgi:hypothetical protein
MLLQSFGIDDPTSKNVVEACAPPFVVVEESWASIRNFVPDLEIVSDQLAIYELRQFGDIHRDPSRLHPW